MARDVSDAVSITSRDDLVAWFEGGSKPAGELRIGTEHEKVPFRRSDRRPVAYGAEGGIGGIAALLDGMREALGWAPIYDGEAIIGLHDEVGGGAISLEPGGQFELSGAPFGTIHETEDELETHFAAVHRVAAPLDIGFLSLGMSPLWSLAETPRMPKQRYDIMTGYMPKVGTRGLDMMYRTATVQANLDFTSEADMVRKLRVSLALQPLLTALFANSPFLDGGLNGRQSERSEIWLDTDRNRTGLLPFAFEDGMGFERYVDYALDVPMYFVKRGDLYHDVSGASFRDLMADRLAALPGERAVLSDWANHLSTIFPEVRLKRYLEMRGADTGARPMLPALPALCAGLLYDATALDAASDLTKPWTIDALTQLRADVPKAGLDATIAGRSLRAVARDVLDIATNGLVARRRLDRTGRDETRYLAPLEAIVEGQNNAVVLAARYAGPWNGNVAPAFAECVF